MGKTRDFINILKEHIILCTNILCNLSQSESILLNFLFATIFVTYFATYINYFVYLCKWI